MVEYRTNEKGDCFKGIFNYYKLHYSVPVLVDMSSLCFLLQRNNINCMFADAYVKVCIHTTTSFFSIFLLWFSTWRWQGDVYAQILFPLYHLFCFIKHPLHFVLWGNRKYQSLVLLFQCFCLVEFGNVAIYVNLSMLFIAQSGTMITWKSITSRRERVANWSCSFRYSKHYLSKDHRICTPSHSCFHNIFTTNNRWGFLIRSCLHNQLLYNAFNVLWNWWRTFCSCFLISKKVRTMFLNDVFKHFLRFYIPHFI